MAKIDDYWVLLPEHNNVIYTELQAIISNRSAEIKKSSRDFLCRCLRRTQLATCKIVQLLPSFIADEIYHTVLLDLLADNVDVDKCNQFLGILINGQFSDELIARFELEIFPKLVNVLVTNKEIDRQFQLCLAVACDDTFRDRFLFTEDRLCATDNLISKRRMFVLTVVAKRHFLDTFINCDDVTRSTLSNDVLQKILVSMQLLRNADHQSIDYKQFVQENSEISQRSTENHLRHNLFNELQRLLNLKEFFSSHHIPNIQVTSYANKFNIIDILYEHINVSKVDSLAIRSLLQENRKYNQRFDFAGNGLVNQLTELELYDSFLVAKLLLEVIVDNQHAAIINDTSVDKLNNVKMILKNIDSIATFTSILEMAFSLVFIRWDNIMQAGESTGSDRTMEESESESTESRKCSSRTEKNAFICSAVALDNILDLLKNAALDTVQSNAFENALDSVKKSFLRLHKYINDAHWRVTLFRTNSIVTGSRSTSFVDDDLRKYFVKHKPQAREQANGSSDDDGSSSQHEASSYRRRPRKKNPLRKSVEDKNLVISISTEHDQRSDTMYRRCPISRMLGSPEHLATVCLNNGNLAATKDIVEGNNLANSIPAKQLKYMENYNATKQQLRSIVGKFNSYGFSDSNDTAANMVERLKHVATIGFEASQMQSIIKAFADENVFLSDEATRNLIKKLHRQHPFLKMFNGPALQATIAVDLIVSLTNSYEMCFNIFNMLTKLWADPSWFDDAVVTTFGYLKFTKNMCECLQLYKSIANNNFGVRDLICNECYVLSPVELKTKLEKERVMKSLQSLTTNDIDSLEKWKALVKPFESIRGDVNYFQRSYNFIVNLMKLLNARDSNVNLTPTDAMQIDSTAVIGEIVFVNGKLPGDIVEIVENLNINFVYVLCANMMPVIHCTEPNDSAVTANLIENLRNDNVPDSSPDEKPLFRLNDEVLSFLRKNNYLVAYLHQEYSCVENPTVVYEQRYMKNLMGLDDVRTVAMIHGGNLLLSALNYDTFDVSRLEKYLYNNANYRNAIRIIQNCSDRSLRIKGDQLKALHDVLIAKLLKEGNNNCDLIEQINDVNIRSKHLLDNILLIESSDMVRRLIQSILLHKDVSQLEESLNVKLNEWLHYIQIYDTVTDRMSCTNWIETRELSINSAELILKCLMKLEEFDLCLAWLKMHPLAECTSKFTEFTDIFQATILMPTTNLNSMMFKIVETLPLNVVLQFYDNLLNQLRNLELLEYMTDFLIANSMQPSVYQQYRISLKIFHQMNDNEQQINWTLFNTPLMIIEQFLMNSRHEALSIILKSIKPILSNEICKYCQARRNSTYDSRSSSDPDFKISLTENDFGHKDHSLSFHCIDSLLLIYASKALDFRVSETHSHSSNELLTHSMASLDSLCGSFVMPKVPPDRLHWIKDEDASHCMCCRRSAFTMLCRRHHCRRCGRVVCHVCSTKRIKIPELYCDVQVRSCDDCYKQIESNDQKQSSNVTSPGPVNGITSDDVIVWQFSGNTKHDILLREEFCFEYAPSVSLCLSILQFYSSDEDCVKFLLYHCQKLESLLRPIQPGYPNPEIDYALVTRMMHCLALAAKVRGGPPECDTIRDHGEIIQSIVHHGCESLMPMEPPNSSSFRTLRDSLVLAEKWTLALDLSLKCGFATTGVMAAWGIACLRAGCFDTAREKFSHCLTKTGSDDETFHLTSLILQESADEATEWDDIAKIKRPVKSPPLLDEILSILKLSCHSHQPEVIARASVIKDSNTSLASIRSKKREQIPLHEPALNVMHTLLSLKNITRGVYDGSKTEKKNSLANRKLDFESANRRMVKSSRFYDECLYYLTRYGSHNSILAFLIENQQLDVALKYFLHQNVDADTFINVIFLPFLKSGKVDVIIKLLMAMDDTLLVWKDVIIKTCCYLEHRGQLNSLYHLQILLKDPVRASMTCVKFYSMNCSTYQELQANSFHLMSAQKHLQQELELCQWEEIATTEESQSILMKMDSRTLNSHINTIWRQIEVTKFLSKCEQSGCDTVALLAKISAEFNKIPTLFGTLQEKIQLAVLTIISGSNINAGFGLAFRIIQDFNLSPIKVYGITAKYLAGHNRLENVEKLIENIKSNSDSDTALCDEIISLAIHTAVAASPLNAPIKQLIGQTIESLLRHVTDVGIKLSCHIAGGQLKSAYLLAVQYDRFNDVKKVLRKAEQTNQQHIKKLCERKLNSQ